MTEILSSEPEASTEPATETAEPLRSPAPSDGPSPVLAGGPGLSRGAATVAGKGALADAADTADTADAAVVAEHAVQRWEARIEDDAEAFWARWMQLGRLSGLRTPFQSVGWLRDWYDTVGAQAALQPVLLRAFDADTGEDRLLLPLVRSSRFGLRILEPADCGVTDQNGPLVHPRLRLDGSSVAGLWAVLRRELGRHGQVLRLRKMPARIDDRPNPLTLGVETRPSASGAHVFRVGERWADWQSTLKRQARRESERHWRIFNGYPDARLERIVDPPRALEVLGQLETLQAARLAATGAYRLGEPVYRAFYRRRLAHGLQDGSVVLTRLASGGDTIAIAFGIREAARLTFLRVSFVEAWKRCSPGRLVLEGTARLLWADGCRVFDLSIGNQAYKSTFGCVEEPLLEACVALRASGLPVALAWRLQRAAP